MRLCPIAPQDYGYLYDISFHPDNLVTWRYRGAILSPEGFGQSLWKGVLTQFKIVQSQTNRTTGLVCAYNADFRNQIVYIAVLLDPAIRRQGWAFEAADLFVSYLFEVWSFRKIYLESFEFNYVDFGSGAGSVFTLEGCLLDYEYHDGTYWHKYIASISRQTWTDRHSDRARFAATRPAAEGEETHSV